MTKRTDRIDELLRQEIGAILARDVADPRIGFVTVTDVETAPDLSHARVWVSVIGQPAERDATIAALGRAMPFLRHQLGERITLRRIPELHVRLDETAQRGTSVLRLLADLESGRDPDQAALGTESLPTPVPRLPHEGDAADEAASASGPSEPRRKGRRARRTAGRRPTSRGPRR
jgi:ribosome-binding factor A